MKQPQSASREFLEALRVLVMVGSTGRDPWLEIEKNGQEPSFGVEVPPWASLVWIEGDVGLSTKIFLQADELSRFALSCFFS